MACHGLSPSSVNVIVSIILSALLRSVAALLPEQAEILLPLANLCWIRGFLGYSTIYAPLILGKR